jgi:hypothetical protein
LYIYLVDGFVQKFMIGKTTLDEGGRQGGREPHILAWLFVEILSTKVFVNNGYPGS